MGQGGWSGSAIGHTETQTFLKYCYCGDHFRCFLSLSDLRRGMLLRINVTGRYDEGA